MRQPPCVGKPKNLGFTLIEVMTVVIIIALLTTSAIPGMQSLIQNIEAQSLASRLAADLRTARSQAINKGTPVTICPIANYDPTVEVPGACVATTAWDAWTSFYDPEMTATEQGIGAGGTAVGTITLSSLTNTGTIVANISGPIIFDPMGFVNINPSTNRSGWTWSSTLDGGTGWWDWNYSYNFATFNNYYRVFTILPAGCTGNNGRTVIVSQNGSIKIANIAC